MCKSLPKVTVNYISVGQTDFITQILGNIGREGARYYIYCLHVITFLVQKKRICLNCIVTLYSVLLILKVSLYSNVVNKYRKVKSLVLYGFVVELSLIDCFIDPFNEATRKDLAQ